MTDLLLPPRELHPTNCSGHYGGTCTCGLIPRKQSAGGKCRPITADDSIKDQMIDLGFRHPDVDANVRAMLETLRQHRSYDR